MNQYPFTVKVYRDTTYIDSSGSERHHYDVCTAFSINDDGSIESQLGKVPADKWDELNPRNDVYFS